MHSNDPNDTAFSLDLEGSEHNTECNALVAIGGELPYNIQIPTDRLLDILTSLSPGFQ